MKITLPSDTLALVEDQAQRHIAAYAAGYRQAIRDLIAVREPQTTPKETPNGNEHGDAPPPAE